MLQSAKQVGSTMHFSGALGGLKGPIMKVAQLMATVPDLLPPEYAEEYLAFTRPDKFVAALAEARTASGRHER